MASKKKTARKSPPPSTGSRGLSDFLFTGNGGEAVSSSPLHQTAKVLFRAKGRLSNFGGPKDAGMTPDEGLAFFTGEDLDNPKHKHLFLDKAPPNTTGMGRRLNPEAYYIACRWDYQVTPASLLRTTEVMVTNTATGISLRARPADWGPHVKTGRIADLSPGLEKALGLKTDDMCDVVLAVSVAKAPAGKKQEAPGAAPMTLATGALQPPKIYSCDEWGASPARRTEFARNRAVGIVIHHTEGANRQPLTAVKEKAAAFATARSIQDSHVKRNGWADTGQHFTISQGGVIMEGRHGSLDAAANGECVQAAHAGNTEKNEKWFGIEICGDNRKTYQVTPQQWSAIVDLCAWLCDSRGGEDLEIIGHQEVHTTTCPGKLMDHLDDLREAITARRHPTADVPKNDSFFRAFGKPLQISGDGRLGNAARKPAARATVKASSGTGNRARFIAAKFIWRYHLDPTVRNQLDPADADWQARMETLRFEHTLLAPLPGTPPDIAAARIKTAAVTLVGICLHPKAEKGDLQPGVSKSQAVDALVAVMAGRKKTVSQLGGALDLAIRFP
ncbi:MAG: N-acetylmuramoyl-L-alanine amidase [Verrucomicrobiota bacterium]